ncbi:MAG: sensor domain-containing phosphodiesterase [Pseudohongiella sp.]|nr:sensor domain-containing phosphodiesterase [Pseudohongiella sp.]
MISPSVPVDETNRLFALYSLRILGTDPEPVYDNIAALARQIYKVPFAGISFVDQHEVWLKTSDTSGLVEIARAQSLCGHGILSDNATIINDILADGLSPDNPGVSGMNVGGSGIRAYCGVPIHAPTGHRVGMLCLVDVVPRSFCESELQPLKLMAATVEELLVRHNNVMPACYIDSLTGLPANLALTDQISLSLARAGSGKHRVSLLRINIDNFRFVNSSIGRAAGDRLIRSVGQRLRPCVGQNHMVFKEPGDNFYVLCQSVSDAALTMLANELAAKIAVPFFEDGNTLELSASIGIASADSGGITAGELMNMAEAALQDAKRRGRDVVCFFDNPEEDGQPQQFEIYSDLKKALGNHEFELCYQPTIETESGRILAMEALLRWNHPRLGLMYPADFIDLAETTGLIVAIGEWVLHEACARAQSWRQDGMQAFVVSVNMSAVQFNRGDICQTISHALTHSGLPANYLEVELTESVLVSGNDMTRETIKDLKQMGVRLAIDDYGTGYSDLSCLRKVQFDKIKIDQSFIRKLGADKEDFVIVKTIKRMADSLGIEVVAEGVETEEELSALQELGISEVQGYLLARPAAREVCKKLISAYLARTLPDKRVQPITDAGCASAQLQVSGCHDSTSGSTKD